jgi:hypothetical protein
LFLDMTDGSYTGLDDATILERLRASSGDDDSPPPPKDESNPREPGDSATGKDAATAGTRSELRARLSTLLGRDEYPGELAGWGPIHAELTRDLARLMAGGQWRFAITDEDGQLLCCGITPARPSGSTRRSAHSREIVELAIPATELHELTRDPGALGAWEPVVSDLARQYANAQHPSDADPTRRTPGAALRRYLQIRDRRCIMIGCRYPPATPTPTTPPTTPTADPPSNATSATPAAMTTASNTTAAGSSTSRYPANSAGPAA